MIRTFTNTYKFSFVQGANTFIYFIKRIPLIGKKVPESLYSKTKAKITLGIIFEIMSFLFGFIKKAIYVGVMIALPALYFSKESGNLQEVALQIFFILSFILGPIINTTLMPRDEKPFNMIRLMRVDAKKYFISEMVYTRVLAFIHFTPVMMLLFSSVKGLILTFEFILIRFIWEFIHLFVFSRFNKMISNMDIFIGTLVIICPLLAYVPLFFHVNIGLHRWIYDYRIIILLFLLSVLSLRYIFKYKRFKDIGKIICTKDNVLEKQKLVKDVQFKDVEINEKKIKVEDLNSNIYENKQGYEYLNAIFFKRYKKLLSKSSKYIIIGSLIVTMIAIGFILWKPSDKGGIIDFFKNKTSSWIFVMYFLSTTERICKAMFFNCDISLLRYGYYRQREAIFSNFKSRLKMVVVFNILPALVICCCIIFIVIASGDPKAILELSYLFLSIIALACFFSIHHLAVYYIIQPYTANLEVKSPLFRGINTVMYVVCYMCSGIDSSSYMFSIGVIIFTVIYMIIALTLVYKLAPKTFRLK